MQRLLACLIVSSFLTSCGGGGSPSSGSTPLAGDSSSTFIDAPVQGLYYVTTSGITGTTDAAGTFRFNSGDTVSFRVGGSTGLELASTTPADSIPTLVTELDGGLQIAQILQSLSTSTDSNSKLDLSSVRLSATQITTLQSHIADRGDLDTFKATSLNSIVSAVGADLGITLSAKGKSDVQTHLASQMARVTTAPRVAGKTFSIFNGEGQIIGIAKIAADLSVKFLDSSWARVALKGQPTADGYTFAVDTVHVPNQNLTAYTQEDATNSCTLTASNLSRGVSGFTGIEGLTMKMDNTSSCSYLRTQLGIFSDTWSFVELDTERFTLSGISGKTLTLQEKLQTACENTPFATFTFENSVPGSPVDAGVTSACSSVLDGSIASFTIEPYTGVLLADGYLDGTYKYKLLAAPLKGVYDVFGAAIALNFDPESNQNTDFSWRNWYSYDAVTYTIN